MCSHSFFHLVQDFYFLKNVNSPEVTLKREQEIFELKVWEWKRKRERDRDYNLCVCVIFIITCIFHVKMKMKG